MSELNGGPPCPKSRSPRAVATTSRADRIISVLNNAEPTTFDRQVQRLSKKFALSRHFAAVVVSLHLGGAER